MFCSPTRAKYPFFRLQFMDCKVVRHFLMGRSGKFAMKIFYFLKADKKHSWRINVLGKDVNAGDRLGMKVPCRLFLFSEEKYKKRKSSKRSSACYCKDTSKKTKSKVYYTFFHFSSHPFDAWKPSIFSSLANSRAFSLTRALLTCTFSLRKFSNHFFNALLSVSHFFGFNLLASRPLSYDCNVFLCFFFPNGCSWAHRKLKQHPCVGGPFRVVWELYAWFLKIYLSVGALLHKWLPCFMPDVDFYLVKIHNVGAIRTFHSAFVVRFGISIC